jgi:hypothetical protein
MVADLYRPKLAEGDGLTERGFVGDGVMEECCRFSNGFEAFTSTAAAKTRKAKKCCSFESEVVDEGGIFGVLNFDGVKSLDVEDAISRGKADALVVGACGGDASLDALDSVEDFFDGEGIFFIAPDGEEGFGFDKAGLGEVEEVSALVCHHFESKERDHLMIGGDFFDLSPSEVGLIFDKDDAVKACLFGAKEDLFGFECACLGMV